MNEDFVQINWETKSKIALENLEVQNVAWREDEHGPYWIADLFNAESGQHLGTTGNYYDVGESGKRLPRESCYLPPLRREKASGVEVVYLRGTKDEPMSKDALKEVTARCAEIPGGEGWQKGGDGVFVEAAIGMVGRGFAVDDAIELLSRLYWAAASEYGV